MIYNEETKQSGFFSGSVSVNLLIGNITCLLEECFQTAN